MLYTMQSDGDVFVGCTCNAVGITFVIISLQKYVQIFFRLFKIRVIGASQRYMTTFKLCHFCAFSWNSVAVFELNDCWVCSFALQNSFSIVAPVLHPS